MERITAPTRTFPTKLHSQGAVVRSDTHKHPQVTEARRWHCSAISSSRWFAGSAARPLFTAITLFTLAVAIGANTVIFSVVDGVLLKPLPYPHPEELIGVWHTAPGINLKELNISPSIYFIDREQSTTLQDIGVYQGDSLNVTGAGQPEHVDGLDVTDGTLPLLGVKPALGRLFTRRDDTAGCAGNRAALLRILAAQIRRAVRPQSAAP